MASPNDNNTCRPTSAGLLVVNDEVTSASDIAHTLRCSEDEVRRWHSEATRQRDAPLFEASRKEAQAPGPVPGVESQMMQQGGGRVAPRPVRRRSRQAPQQAHRGNGISLKSPSKSQAIKPTDEELLDLQREVRTVPNMAIILRRPESLVRAWLKEARQAEQERGLTAPHQVRRKPEQVPLQPRRSNNVSPKKSNKGRTAKPTSNGNSDAINGESAYRTRIPALATNDRFDQFFKSLRERRRDVLDAAEELRSEEELAADTPTVAKPLRPTSGEAGRVNTWIAQKLAEAVAAEVSGDTRTLASALLSAYTAQRELEKTCLKRGEFDFATTYRHDAEDLLGIINRILNAMTSARSEGLDPYHISVVKRVERYLKGRGYPEVEKEGESKEQAVRTPA